MKVIFLDIDGVLNGHEWCHRGGLRINQMPARVLNAIVQENECSVVVSSTWARHIEKGDCTATGFSWMLRTHGIECKVVDGINGMIIDPKIRTDNILKWVEENKPDKWIAIDDLPLQLPYFIRPNPAIGLTPVDVKNANQLFQIQA